MLAREGIQIRYGNASGVSRASGTIFHGCPVYIRIRCSPLAHTGMMLRGARRLHACTCRLLCLLGKAWYDLGMNRTFFRTTAIAALLGGSLLTAQEVTEFKRPGDVIRLEIKFDGPDAPKVKTVSLYLGTNANPANNQAGFANLFQTGESGPSSPNTFDVDAKIPNIPNNVATGDYILSVNAQAETGRTTYAAGTQFQLPPFHIRNDRTFTPPKITVLERREP